MIGEPAGPIKKLQDWIISECNGDWEHSFGVTIESSDNPGWIIKIDLEETKLADRGPIEKRWAQSKDNWQNISITHSAFEASCSLTKLEDTIDEFIYFSNNFTLRA